MMEQHDSPRLAPHPLVSSTGLAVYEQLLAAKEAEITRLTEQLAQANTTIAHLRLSLAELAATAPAAAGEPTVGPIMKARLAPWGRLSD